MFMCHRHGPINELDYPHALGLTRFRHSGQSRFVTFCCYHRRPLLNSDESSRIFESALERVRRSYRLYVYGHVVMAEHVYLLLSEPQRSTAGRCIEVAEGRVILSVRSR